MKLEEIYEPIRENLRRTDDYLRDQIEAIGHELGLGSKLDKFAKEAVRHLFERPGKGLRPALLLLSAGSTSPESLDWAGEALVRSAAAVELVHSASLIHDDVIDEAVRRRSAATVNRRFGTKTAILAGDILFIHAFDVLAELPGVAEERRLTLLQLFANLTKRMCYGEMLEQQARKKPKSLNRDGYIAILEDKTAMLMSVSCMCGALLAGGSEEIVENHRRFGLNFGLAYQLADDYMDRDAVYRGSIDLLAEAHRHVLTAKDALCDSSAKLFKERLAALSDFVVDRAR